MKRFVTFFLIFFLLTSATFALDFIAAGDTEVDAFKCLNTEGKIYLSNPNEEAIDISLAVDGTAADYVKFFEFTFQLAAGETKELTIFYDIPCGAVEGIYDLDIYFYSADVEKLLSQIITIYTPDTLLIDVAPTAQEINPCGTAVYEININNQVNLEENYSLSLDAFEGEYALEESFILQPYTDKKLELKITPDDCKKYGNFTFNLIAKTEKTALTKFIPLELNIKSYGVLEISPEIDRIRTDYSQTEAEILVQNFGDSDVEYEIYLDGPEWVSAQDKIMIQTESQTFVNLILNPGEAIEKGEYPVLLKLTRTNTNISYEKQFTVSLKKLSIFSSKPQLIIVPLLIIVIIALLIGGFLFCKKSEKFKKWRKEFAKRKSKHFTLIKKQRDKLSKKKFKELEQKEAKRQKKLEDRRKKKEEKKRRKEEKMALKKKKHLEKIAAKEKARTDLKKEIKNKLQSEFKFIPKTSIKKSCATKKFPWWIIAILFALILVFFFKVYGLVIALLVVLDLIYLKAKSAKIFKKRWKFLEKGIQIPLTTNWRTGIYALNMLTSKNVEKLLFIVKRISTKIVRYKTYMGFSISTNIEDTIKITDMKLRVCKKWMKRKNISLDDFRLLKLVKICWKSQPITLIRSDKKYYYFNVEKLTPGDFALAGKPTPTTKKPFNIFWIAVIGLIALFAIQPLMAFKGMPPQVWTKDTQHNLNLNDFFYDPDCDQLTYSAEAMQNIQIEFREDMVILTPKAGWTGEEYTTFYAADPSGEEAISNPVKLVVKENVFFEKSLGWINIIILALLLFLVVLVLFEKKSK